MKVSRINAFTSPSFKGKIIDAHTHIGKWGSDNFKLADVDKFIKNPLPNGDTVEKAIISALEPLAKGNMSCEFEGNKALLNTIKDNEIYMPLASCNPKTGSVENIKKLFGEFKDKFAGLKFHPDAGEYFATDDIVKPYLEFAKENKLPCVFHTAISYKPQSPEFVDEAFRYSSPDKIYDMAKQYKDVPVVMAHMGSGGEKVHNIALSALKDSITNNDATLYADISRVDCNDPAKPNIIKAIKMLKEHEKGDMTSRLLFGSDVPVGEFKTGMQIGDVKYTGEQFYQNSISDTKNAIKKAFPEEGDSLIDKIFYKNAKNLFFKNAEKKTNTVLEDTSKNKEEAIKTIAAKLSGSQANELPALPPPSEEIKNNDGFWQKICTFAKQNKTACIAFAGALAVAGITAAVVVSHKKKKSQGINNASASIKASVNVPLPKNNTPKVFTEFSTFA